VKIKFQRFTSTTRWSKFLCIAILSLGLFALTNSAWAEGEHPHAAHDLAKQSQNPVSMLIRLSFENNATLNNGPDDDLIDILNIKPVIPMSFIKNWNLINRAIVPAIYSNVTFPGEDAKFGLGDIIYQGFFSPAKPGKFIWGLGAQLNLPTGMERFTSDQWSLGPAAVGLMMPGPWVVGLLVSNVWSIYGYNDASHVNEFTAQYFINYNMKGGWYLTSSPVITANWENQKIHTWTIPYGGGVGRVFKIGKQAVDMKGAAYINHEKPEYGSDWNLQFSITFLFPKK
jgi:hypothetical protein